MTDQPDTEKNLSLWRRVSETDPRHTKEVSLGRKFTAIDPYYQIFNATQQFGPAGQGWGWAVTDVQHLPTSQVAVLVRVWHGDHTKWIEQWGQAGLYIDRDEKKKDTDCMKKATTDGLTKCLSYLGFNADVFMGMFEDNKYVQAQLEKATMKDREDDAKKHHSDDLNWCNEVLGTLANCKSLEEVEDLAAHHKDRFQAVWKRNNDIAKDLKGKIDEARSKFSANPSE